ncbi:protein SCAI homolog [Juglans microcarpa x Juglans regia]|uniref:protein SCAI homolog n=1 Tax=Juglans microcarpa x Juglans regia TaxID=2249226 RepID=UPI001B7F05C3|nr:protein SCAI homolog [Juglans microcarpa x Juglans regia]
MSHSNNSNSNSNSNSNVIPVTEVYWSLVEKADKKFSKIRDLPHYQRNRYDVYFYKVFKVYTQLWKFQQENRQKLVEAGLKRWEIGEIASRIAQLYFGQYMRTSDASYLSESYIFYEAILTREYFKEGLFQDVNLANKQLRFLARFLVVCLVLNRREMVHQLVNQLKLLVDECKRTFQETDFKEWRLVVQEIVRFLKADTAFMNIRPLRYSLFVDPHPDSIPHLPPSIARRNLRLRDAILSSYHTNEVKFSELTLDTFRMLQCLEWEPSGSLYQSSGTRMGQNGAPGPCRMNYSQNITDPTLPPNPRKAVLYRPSVTHFIAVLATVCEELPLDGILLLYLSASGSGGLAISSPRGAETYVDAKGNCARKFQSDAIYTDENPVSPFSLNCDSLNPSSLRSQGDYTNSSGCLQFGTRGNGGLNYIYPCDFVPFTRRPLFLVIDSDNSEAFKAIVGAEKGEPVAMLLSPSSSSPIAAADSSHHPSGSLFTIFLTAPLQAFGLLLGLSGSDIEMETFNKAEKLLSLSLSDWGLTLIRSDTLNPVWAQTLSDPFLRRLLIRFLFCQAVLMLYAPTFNKKEFHPMCMPPLPSAVLPTATNSQIAVMQIANIFGAVNSFIFSEGVKLPENRHGDDMDVISSY